MKETRLARRRRRGWWLSERRYAFHLGHCSSFFFVNWNIVAWQCWVSSCCTWISYMYTYIPSLGSLPLPSPTPLCHRRTPSWAPCALQQLPTSYLFDTWECKYVSPTQSRYLFSQYSGLCRVIELLTSIPIDSKYFYNFRYTLRIWFLCTKCYIITNN